MYGTKWFSADVEMEAGCGIAPIKYRNKSLVHAWQWAIGLEWYLLVDDPWRVVMSTDHPNGGSFLAYPQIIRLLMDSTYRKDVLKTCHAAVREGSVLKPSSGRAGSLHSIGIVYSASEARTTAVPACRSFAGAPSGIPTPVRFPETPSWA